MSEDFENLKPSRNLRSSTLSPQMQNEVHDLMNALLEDQMTAAQRQRLETLAVADPGVAELCLALMHLSCSIPFHVLSQVDLNGSDNGSDHGSDKDAQLSLQALMHETLIVPGIREVESRDVNEAEAEPAFSEMRFPTADPEQEKKKGATPWLWGTAAAILIAATIAVLALRGNDHARETSRNTVPNAGRNTAQDTLAAIAPAVISATAGVETTESNLLSPGVALPAGRRVRFSGGAIELTFASGAVAVVRGPADFELTDQNTIDLHDGSMSAHVPFAARGFRVNSQGLAAIDRGTDFGVRTVADTNASEVHVFGGSVDVLALDAGGQPVSAPIRAVATQAYQHDSADTGAPVLVAFAEDNFSRNIASIRQPISLHSTGGTLVPGSPDPYWQLVTAPPELKWKPRQASVISDSSYPDSPGSSDVKWISTDKDRTSVPSGNYVFRTKVDLTGFDPATVSVEACATADDWVADIRVNGVSTGLSTEAAESHDRFVPSTLTIPNTFWRSGVNEVDVVVNNKTMDGGGINATGLQLGWSATGCPLVKR